MSDPIKLISNLIADFPAEKRALLADLIRPEPEPIAIIGMGCRFPGECNSPQEFWEFLQQGGDGIVEVPPDRWNIDAIYDPDPTVPGKVSTRWGGFLSQADTFDASFFGISPREAVAIDPQHRILLEVAWEALEHAGQTRTSLSGTQVGVFVGVFMSDYGDMILSEPERIGVYEGYGITQSIAANRLSYELDLRGPSVAIDTACSSSLVALHLACQSLRSGESEMALTGGVNLIFSPRSIIAASKASMMAPDGRCKTFDSRADGFVRSEGCGVVVLKRLSDARASGDPILALVRGSSVNQDGRTTGLTAPNGLSQQAVIRQALTNAGIEPTSVSFIETHGTGTSLGDPIEVEALSEVYGQPRPNKVPCVLGGVKANIGHLEAAAGIAGMIKAILAFQHQAIPPQPHFKQLNPNISLQNTPFVIPTEIYPWFVDTGHRIAAVSSFGVGGTNAHVILEEPPIDSSSLSIPDGIDDVPHLLPISAHTPSALHTLAGTYHDFLASEASSLPPLAHICYTASLRRTHHSHRLALVATSPQMLLDQIDAFLQNHPARGLTSGTAVIEERPKIVFICPGQGSQWPGMARNLLAHEPVFREVMTACDQVMRGYGDWSLLEMLQADPAPQELHRIDIIQPALFAMEIGLAALWQHWGVQPDAIVGHSMGEVAAAYLIGSLSLEDAAQIICRRSQLLRRTSGQGAMAVVDLPMSEARKALSGYEDHLAVAVSNSPRSTVISGDPRALDAVVDRLQAQDVFCRSIQVDVASHSPQMDPLLDELAHILTNIAPRSGSMPMYSTVTDTIISGQECGARYWVRNLREPVHFGAAVQRLLTDGIGVFIELSPHPILLHAVEDGVRHVEATATLLPSMRREEDGQQVLREGIGRLWTQGYSPHWQSLYPAGGQCVALPNYPWERERFWFSPSTQQALSTRRLGAGGHPLLGMYVQSVAQPGEHLWEADLNSSTITYLVDHQVQGVVILPAAAYLELALAAAIAVKGAGAHYIESMAFEHMLALVEDMTYTLQVALVEDGFGQARIQVASRPVAADAETAWIVHAHGIVRWSTPDLADGTPPQVDREALQAECPEYIKGTTLYASLHARGYAYGPSFQGIHEVWHGQSVALARLELPPAVMQAANYHVHPSLLDTCFQTLAATISTDTQNVYLPVGVRQYHWTNAPVAGSWSYTRLHTPPSVDSKTLEGDVVLLAEDGTVVAEAYGLRMQRLESGDTATTDDPIAEWLYTLRWDAVERPVIPPPDQPGRWLVFADSQGVAATLAEYLENQGASVVWVIPGTHFEHQSSNIYELDTANPTSLEQLLREAFSSNQPPCQGIVHLWSLDTSLPAPDAVDRLPASQELAEISVLHLVQALAQIGWRDMPRLWLVTQGLQAVVPGDEAGAITQAPLWGLGRVIATEHPELQCTRIDLDGGSGSEAGRDLFAELWAANHENEIALRKTGRYVARMVRHTATQAHALTEQELALATAGKDALRLEVLAPGRLDSLRLCATERPAPGPGEVEITVRAAGIAFRDVLRAMGRYPGDGDGPIALGAECAGTVSAVGAEVTNVQVGDDVVALASACFGSFVIARAAFVMRRPAHLSFAEAATIPSAFFTAYHALHQLARIRPGERVLIHAASGGVGLAAVQLAKNAGAEIFVTAGNPEKQAYLRDLGIQHVFNSRSLDFADEIMAHTDGRGVDVVLNSLSGVAIPKSLDCMAPYGRFIEIGKKDIYQNSQLGLYPFHKCLGYFAVDLDRLFLERSEMAQSLVRELAQLFNERVLQPLPCTIFSIDRAEEAFRLMAQARHIGKLVLDLPQQSVRVIPPARMPVALREDGTYLITGGLGGIGLAVAEWLVAQGARHLILVGRRAPSPDAQDTLDRLRQQAKKVGVVQADISKLSDVARVLAEIDRALPPLRGIFHAAGVLADSVLLNLDHALFRQVMAPKVNGAWNLHILTLSAPLDYFVLFSSAAALLGSPGQGNYVAGNSFMDALAHHRRVRGLPALSINWGPWDKVGLAASQDNRGARLAFRGFTSLTPEQGVEALHRVLGEQIAQIGILPFNARQWCQFYPKATKSPLLSQLLAEELVNGAQKQASTLRNTLETAQPTERREVLETHLLEQLAQVLRLPQDRITAQTAIGSLGVDSLMALELRNRLESNLGLSLPATVLWSYPTIAALTEYLATKIGLPLDAASEGDTTPADGRHSTPDEGDNEELSGLLDEIEQLSDADVRQLLSE